VLFGTEYLDEFWHGGEKIWVWLTVDGCLATGWTAGSEY
jgi:hypothetical protein